MTQIFPSKKVTPAQIEYILPENASVGDVAIINGVRYAYGPDPWGHLYVFNCWFNLDTYIKEEGKPPSYVSDSDKKSLGL